MCMHGSMPISYNTGIGPNFPLFLSAHEVTLPTCSVAQEFRYYRHFPTVEQNRVSFQVCKALSLVWFKYTSWHASNITKACTCIHVLGLEW